MSNPLYSPTDQDLKDALMATRPKDDPLKLDAVRAVLATILENRTKITGLFQEHLDDGDALAGLIDTLNALLPKKKSEINANNHGAGPCADMLIGLYRLFDLFISMKASERIPSFLSPVMDMMKIVKTNVFLSKVAVKNSAFLKMPLEVNRPFMVNAEKPTQGYETCVLCGHCNVDFPNINKGVRERNKAKMEQFETQKREVEAAKAQDKDSKRVSGVL